MSKRESNRREKKQQIIDAARQLMKCRDSSGFSMRTLAEVAGVSVATPYSLFGSKQGVIAAVMDTDLDDFRGALLRDTMSPIDVFFHAVTISRQLFETDPYYYKTGAAAVHTQDNEELSAQFSLPRHNLLRDLVQHAIREGYLSHRTNAESLALALGQQFYGWIQAWARDKISLNDLEHRTHYGFALSLCAVANGEHREALLSRVFDIQQNLPEAWQITSAVSAAS